MSCGGCRERGEAMRKAMLALAEGRGDDAREQIKQIGRSAATDAASVRDAVAASAERLRNAAASRLGMRRR